jgi:DUF438 domain-containing protein
MVTARKKSKVTALTGLLSRIEEDDDLRGLCGEAGQLAEEVDKADIATAEQALIDKGYSLQMARHLLTLFVFMGRYQKNTRCRQGALDDNHILRRITVEHDLFRCYAAELNALADTISHLEVLSDVSAEFRLLVRVARYLYILHEHMEREEDIVFPYLRNRGYKNLCSAAEKEHVHLRESVDNLMGLVLSVTGTPLEEFKIRLMVIVERFYPLLLDHLDFEEGLIHPIALVAIDNPGTWESIKALCDQIGYCELPC